MSSPSDEPPVILLVRFQPRTEANPFLLLNQKITQLNDEVARRVTIQEALERSEAALLQRAKEAEALIRIKDEFLATVSHELRTPLNAILGWSTLLRGRSGKPDVEKGFEVIQRNATSQAKLIDDILDVSRIISGKLQLEKKPVEVTAIVHNVVEAMRPSADAKQIHIEVVHPHNHCFVEGDPERLQQAVWNLLSNAVKFTDHGGAVLVDVNEEGAHVVLRVVDTGCGIDEAFLPFVFDRFKQANSTTTRRAGGLGLGLALVRHIAELHGGQVKVSSDGIGKGTTFTLQLPVRARAAVVAAANPLQPVAENEHAGGASQRLAGLHVLVVDDDLDARELIAEVLTLAGAKVQTADSASAALTALTQFKPHLLVSDVGMPEEDGYSLIKRLRSRKPDQGGAIPALALTAYTRKQDRDRALSAGFDAHMGKPVDLPELLALVAKLAEGSGA